MAVNFSYCLLSLFTCYRLLMDKSEVMNKLKFMSVLEMVDKLKFVGQSEFEDKSKVLEELESKFMNLLSMFIVGFCYHLAWIMIVVIMASVIKREVRYLVYFCVEFVSAVNDCVIALNNTITQFIFAA